MKQFVFLYPIPQIMDFEIKNNSYGRNFKSYKTLYKKKLNECIDLRYRQEGYKINYALFDDCSLSEIMDFKEKDRIIKVGLDFKVHTIKREDDTYPYPSQDYILDQLGEVDRLIVTGFHMWDCVERLARRAYERNLDVLVDEDLTEFFPMRLRDKKFSPKKYPSFNPKEDGNDPYTKLFLAARKDKPWLFQNY